MQKNVLNINNLFYSYDDLSAPIFEDFSFNIKSGEIVSLLGESGAGKTTLIRLITGSEIPQVGDVSVYGQLASSNGKSLIAPEKRNISVMFQDFALFPHLTVRKNIEFACINLSEKEKPKAVKDILKLVKMKDFADRYPYELSGGQQQRVSLARALVNKPKLILMDEPFSSLDTNLRDELRDEILHILKKTGCSAMIITHDPSEAMYISDKIVLIDNGKIIQTGSPKDMYFKPKSEFISGFFGEVNIIPAKIKNNKAITKMGEFKTKLPDKKDAKVVIRTEAVKIKKSKHSKNKIIDIKNLGMNDLIHINSIDKIHIHCRIHNMHKFKKGDRVDISFNKELVFVF